MPNSEEKIEHTEGEITTPATEPATETAAEAPTETPVEAPTETPVEAPTETPVEAPTETPVEAPTETPVEAPTETPVEAPTETPVEAPTETPVEAPTDAPLEAPAETPAEAPVQPPLPPTPNYYDRYTVKESEEEGKRAKRAGRIRQAILATVLALSLLSVTLLGGVALGRITAPAVPGGSSGTTTQNGGGSGSGTGDKPTTNRGDLILNVVERVEGAPAPGSIASIVSTVKNTVVEISTTETIIDPFNGNYVSGGAGSGVLIDAGNVKGLILTCNHVIDGADKNGIKITLADGRTFDGTQVELLGADSWSDLALLRITDRNGNEPDNLNYAKLATSGSASDYSYLSVGETVIAIGNPLGELGGSVSSGIISALGREVTVDGTPMTLLQTDASVNPGNSGGGLFNMAGELIGIVNAKSTGDAVEGIGFAIPSSDAIPIVGELYTQGYVSNRPFLGLYFSTSSGYYVVTDYLYNDELTGDYRIQSGDYVTHINGKKVTSTNVIRAALANAKVGDTVSMTFVRIKGYSQETFTLDLIVHEYTP